MHCIFPTTQQMKKTFQSAVASIWSHFYTRQRVYQLLTITLENISHSDARVAQCLMWKDTHLSGSFGILNKEIPGLFFALLPHHRAMQYVPPAFDSLQICFICEGLLTVFLLKLLFLLLFIHVLVTNDLVGIEISAFNEHSTFRPSGAILIILSGITSSFLTVHEVCFHFG